MPKNQLMMGSGRGFHRWVHDLCHGAGCLTLWLPHIVLPEQKPQSSRHGQPNGPQSTHFYVFFEALFVATKTCTPSEGLVFLASDCLVKLDNSMRSASVTCFQLIPCTQKPTKTTGSQAVNKPLGPQQTPLRAKFLRNSQPKAPQPTMKYLVKSSKSGGVASKYRCETKKTLKNKKKKTNYWSHHLGSLSIKSFLWIITSCGRNPIHFLFPTPFRFSLDPRLIDHRALQVLQLLDKRMAEDWSKRIVPLQRHVEVFSVHISPSLGQKFARYLRVEGNAFQIVCKALLLE